MAVEDIKKNDVGSHYGKENDHDVTELELCGIENAMTGNVHHTVRKAGTEEDAYGGNCHDGPETCRLAADGGIQKVYGIVRHSHPQVKEGKGKQKCHNANEKQCHIYIFIIPNIESGRQRHSGLHEDIHGMTLQNYGIDNTGNEKNA